MSWYCVICGADIGNQHYYASDTTLHWKSEYRVGKLYSSRIDGSLNNTLASVFDTTGNSSFWSGFKP